MTAKLKGILLALILILLLAFGVFATGGDFVGRWDLTILTERWGIPPGSGIWEQLDPTGPRYQLVDVPHPGWLYPPKEREEMMFPQVITPGMVDLQEGLILPVQGEVEGGEGQAAPGLLSQRPDLGELRNPLWPDLVGLTWKYTGHGSEYAAFTSRVVYRDQEMVQVAIDNSGTTTAVVYEVEPHRVTKWYWQEGFDGEENLLVTTPWVTMPQWLGRQQVVLWAPFQVGDSWQSGDAKDEIVIVESVDDEVEVPAGRFTEVVRLRIQREGRKIHWSSMPPG